MGISRENRLTHHVHIVAIEGDSFWLKTCGSSKAAKERGPPTEADRSLYRTPAPWVGRMDST